MLCALVFRNVVAATMQRTLLATARDNTMTLDARTSVLAILEHDEHDKCECIILSPPFRVLRIHWQGTEAAYACIRVHVYIADSVLSALFGGIHLHVRLGLNPGVCVLPCLSSYISCPAGTHGACGCEASWQQHLAHSLRL